MYTQGRACRRALNTRGQHLGTRNEYSGTRDLLSYRDNAAPIMELSCPPFLFLTLPAKIPSLVVLPRARCTAHQSLQAPIYSCFSLALPPLCISLSLPRSPVHSPTAQVSGFSLSLPQSCLSLSLPCIPVHSPSVWFLTLAATILSLIVPPMHPCAQPKLSLQPRPYMLLISMPQFCLSLSPPMQP